MTEPPEDRPKAADGPLVLLCEGHEWTARAIASTLTPEGYRAVHVHSAARTMERLRELAPDAVLLNARPPDMEGTDLCRAVRGHPALTTATPILVMAAGQLPRAERLEFLRSGAWEFLHFPTHAEELVVKLATFLDAKLEADRVRHEGILDADTGLYNVRGLIRRVREVTAEAGRHHRPVACVVFAPELEMAEENPDGRGLRHALAAALRRWSRGSDAVARLGASQFMVLAPSTDGAGARAMAGRLIRGLEEEFRTVTGGGGPGLRLRAGSYAIPDFAEAEVESVEVLARATLALRRSQADLSGDPIRFYDGNAG